MIAAAARLAASPTGRRACLAAGLAATALLALAPGDLAPVAARAALAAGALFAVAALARRRGCAPAAAAPLSVIARASLSAGTGVALVEAEGRRLLVGFGRDGVRLLSRVGDPQGEGGRP